MERAVYGQLARSARRINVSNSKRGNSFLEKILIPIVIAVLSGTVLLYLEYRTELFGGPKETPLFTPQATLLTSPSIQSNILAPTTTPTLMTQITAPSKLYNWIPFHVISSSCTTWTSSTHNNFNTSLIDGVFTVDGIKQEGTFWAEEGGFEVEESFNNIESITVEMTGSWTGDGSGWRAGVKLADVQNSVYLAGVYDAPRNLSFLTITTHTGRYEYPLDIGGCGDEIIIADKFTPGELHTYTITYFERVVGANSIGSITASVDGGKPFELDLPWKLTNPGVIIFASSRGKGDSVHAVIRDLVITHTP